MRLRRLRMDAGYGSGNGRLTGSQLRALAAAQTWRVRAVGIVVPVAVGACIAAVGACWVLAAGAMAATHAMLAFTQAYPLAVGVCAVAVFTGDPLVEVQAATPAEFRAVQTLRAAVLLVAAVAGGFALFAPLHLAGAIYGDPAGSARFRRRAGQLSWCWSRMRRRFPGRRARRRSS